MPEPLRPLAASTETHTGLQNNTEFVPLANARTGGLIHRDSNFVLLFGSVSSGKSVILASMLYYLTSRLGVLRPNPREPNTEGAARATVLLSDFFDSLPRGILPPRTTIDQVTRLDFLFTPNNKSKKVRPINLTFLETAGENNYAIRRGGQFHSSLDTYLSAQIPLSVIIVTSRENAQQEDAFIYEFLNKLRDRERNLRSLNIILVISKWDTSGTLHVANANELDEFIAHNLPMTNAAIDTGEFSKSFYTIGEIGMREGKQKIIRLDLSTAKVLSHWLYKSIAGYPLNYEGTFWERIKFSFSK